MRSSRSVRNRGKRRSKAAMNLDITSLLDILVILLVFLLRSYNTSGIVLSVPKDVKLPDSQSTSDNNLGVLVQVSAKQIWVDDQEVLNFEQNSENNFDQGGRRIIPLYNKLVQKREEVELLHKTLPQTKPFSGIVNLVVDKDLKYSLIKKLMYTSAEAGFMQYKFVVLGEEQF